MSVKGHVKAGALWVTLSNLKIELEGQATKRILEKLEGERQRRKARKSPLATVVESDPPDAEPPRNLPTRSDSSETVQYDAPNLLQETRADNTQGVEGDGHGSENPGTSAEEYKDIEPGEECRFPMQPSGFLNEIDIRNLYLEGSGLC